MNNIAREYTRQQVQILVDKYYPEQSAEIKFVMADELFCECLKAVEKIGKRLEARWTKKGYINGKPVDRLLSGVE